MSNFKIKIDMKKFEKDLNKQLEKIVYEQQRELIIKNKIEKGDNEMNILPQKEEELLRIILNKYDGNEEMQVNGSSSDIPRKMQFDQKDIFNTLKLYNYIGDYRPWLNGWSVILNKEGIDYFKKKGMRQKLFEELAENEKDLLKEIIEADNKNENINELIENKLKNDKKDIIKGIIGVLHSNGLVDVFWAANTPYRISLTNPGRTYFEREEKYYRRMKENAKNTYNFGNIYADRGNVILGNVENSFLNIDNSINRIENRIEQECDEEDKKEITELLEETKEIVENIKKSGTVGQRKSYFKKLTNHACKYGWLYAEVVGLLGNVAIELIGGK